MNEGTAADTEQNNSQVSHFSLENFRSRVDRMGSQIEANLPMENITALTKPLMRKRDIAEAIAENQNDENALSKCLNAFDLTAIGVGCIIGAGIFVLTGVAAHEKAGPSLMFSFLFAGVACVFSALCYAEFAARVPIAGSAYTYAYTTVGEFIAWIIGWNLVLEYTIGAATVARGWSGYLVQLLKGFGVTYPEYLYNVVIDNPYMVVNIDATAATSIIVITIILAVGVKESTRFNMIVVVITMGVIGFIIVSGFYLGTFDNWEPFFPYGVAGVFRGSATIFFAYVGFDAVATAAEEAKNPKRDLPIGILASLSISTVLYVLVTAVLTLMVPYSMIDNNSPLAAAFANYNLGWAQILVAFGAFAALTTSILGNLLSQPRIFFSMARDGLLFSWFAQIHPKFQTPMNATLTTGAASALLALLLDIETLADMVSIGTLLAFTIVCSAVLTIRFTSEQRPYQSATYICLFVVAVSIAAFLVVFQVYWIFWAVFVVLALIPAGMMFTLETVNIPENFATPLVPLVPLLGITFNIFMMANLGYATWIRLVVWLIIGVLFYFVYGIRNSKLARPFEDTEVSMEQVAEIELEELPREKTPQNPTSTDHSTK